MNLGQMPQNYWKNMRPELQRPAGRCWECWAERNLSGDEDDVSGDATKLKVFDWSKKSHKFDKNESWEPILPDNVLNLDLALQKHIIRSFVRDHYRKAFANILLHPHTHCCACPLRSSFRQSTKPGEPPLEEHPQ